MSDHSKPRIERPSHADIRSVWPGEARDFTPWLAENLDWLDDLGLGPLSIVGVEVTLPDTGRSLDILAETADGRRVAIENQYGQADHDHLTRGLAYAIGLDAHALIVIAEGHRQEFRAIADYLNHAQEQMDTDDGIAVLLVEVHVEKIGDTFVPRFAVCSEPNDWRAKAQASTSHSAVSVDEFLASVADPQRAQFENLIKRWGSIPGLSVVPQSRTVTLRVDDAANSRRSRSLFNLESTGRVWINAGLIEELPHSEGASGAAALLSQHLPDAEATGKGVWWRVEAPAAEAILGLTGEVGLRE